jgi:hypothetical protein
MIDYMRNNKTPLLLLICCFVLTTIQARTIRSAYSGNWYDGNTWEGGQAPSTLDVVTVSAGNTIFVFGGYADCDSLTINGFLDVGQTNFTVGGRDLYTDYRAIRNTSCIINGGLRINGNVDTQFKVYGNMKFNSGSTFEMLAGKIMIDGAAFTPELSVPAGKALLDVSDVASFNQSGGLIIFFNPHFFQGGLCIKGARNFHAISFGNNNSLSVFAARTTNDFLLSETEPPTMRNLYLKYLPNPNHQNQVILKGNRNIETLQSDIGALVVQNGILKFSKDVLLSENVPIEGEIELNGTGEQKFGTTNNSNNLIHLKGNLTINNPNKVQCFANVLLENGTVKFLQGKMDLTDKTLTVSTQPTGANDNSYFITKNNYTAKGTLVIRNLQGETTFPVGTDNDYLPAKITSWGNDFAVSARPLASYPNGGLFPTNIQWDITRTAGYNPADIELQWVRNVENYNFTQFRRSAKIYRGEWGNWFPLGNQDWGYKGINDVTFSKKVPSIDYFTAFTVLAETIIPVELKRFFVKNQSNNTVNLVWETATESNNVGFDVEKSMDGTHFSSIGFVKGAGNSVALTTYNFEDNNFNASAYYRLKQRDIDGKITYSDIISAQKNNGKLALNVYPNLISNQSDIAVDIINAAENIRDLSIFDTNGRLVYTANLIKNATSFSIPVNDLAKGIYFIKTQIGKEIIVSKFVKN